MGFFKKQVTGRTARGYGHQFARSLKEIELGRRLKGYELVHHKDENPLNNDLSNLVVVDRSTHKLIHTGKRRTP